MLVLVETKTGARLGGRKNLNRRIVSALRKLPIENTACAVNIGELNMLKKISWIVALFAALTMAFVGCTNLGVDPNEVVEEVTRVDLGEPGFNTIAGSPKQQQGWATNGYVDSDAGVTIEGAAYTIDDFKKAKYLVIETAKNAMGGLHLIWQSKNFQDPGWRTQDFEALANDSKPKAGVKKESNSYGGQQIKIELGKVFGASYNNYLAAEDNIRLVLAYYSPDLDDLNVKEAYLLLPATPVAGNTSAPGLMPKFGLGDTTIRNSANEYGWKFTAKDKKGKLPKGIGDVAKLRDATHFFLVSKEGGVSAGNGVSVLAGYEQLSVILEAGGNSYETKLYNDIILFTHRDETVIFAIELDKLNGYNSTIGAKVTQADLDKKPSPPAGILLNDYKWKNVNVIVKYASAIENFGLKAGYILTDEDADDPPDGNDDFDALVNDGTVLKYTFLTTTPATPDKTFGYIKGDTSGAIKGMLKSKGIELPSLMETIEEKKGALGDFTLKQSDSQFVWGFNGVDGDIDFSLVSNAKYLVLETRGTTTQIGGMRIVTQSSADGFAWAPNNNNPWGNYAKFGHAASDTVYIVIDVTTLAGWSTGIATASSGKIILQYWDVINLGLRDAYLIPNSAATAFAKANFTDAKDQDELDVASGPRGGDPDAATSLKFYLTKAANFKTALSTLYSW
jgi:hypothetical protein